MKNIGTYTVFGQQELKALGAEAEENTVIGQEKEKLCTTFPHS